VRQEQGLVRNLGARQQGMLAIGGAIGTGLFLGSGLSLASAGPGVIVSYVLMAGVALLLGFALTEMCVAHPAAGSFGVYAEMYLSPFAGYAVRLSYWMMQVIATGGHLVAVSIYMRYWFPHVPGGVWTVGFSLILLWLNARAVATFAEFEYWFVMIKVVAVFLFVALGLAWFFGWTGEPSAVRSITADGGLFPMGLKGVWFACCFVIYSFIGVEVVAVTSGEAADPERTIPRAMIRMILGLSVIYVATVAVLVAIMPWRQAGVGESPFVTVLARTGIPAAGALMNFVVLTAALSAANANLYLVARMLFSLARAGFVPSGMGRVNERGVPVSALVTSSVGLAVAVLVQWLWRDSAYVWFLGVALFGALLVWTMIFVCHLAFRRAWTHPSAPPLRFRSPLGSAGSVVGALVVLAILASTWWTPGLRPTLLAAGPWILVVALGYRLTRPRRNQAEPSDSRLAAAAGGVSK
jgi:L-asparagine transporter-like permease